MTGRLSGLKTMTIRSKAPSSLGGRNPSINDQGTDLMNDDANSHKPSKPLFDPTINYGHVLTALSIIIAGTGAYYGMSVELHNVDQRVAKIEATLQQLANVVVITAR